MTTAPTPPRAPAPEPLALRPREAAAALGISTRKLWELTNRGIVPHLKIGRCTVYPIGPLRDWLDEQAGKGGRR